MSQCDVDQPRPRLDDKHEESETYFESDLVEEMNKLDIGILLSSSPIVSIQRPQTPPLVPPPTLDDPKFERGYRPLKSIKDSPWDPDLKLYNTPQEPSRYRNLPGGNRGGRGNYHGKNGPRLSSDLIAAIFRDITKTRGGKRFARLRMDNSGRWRVVYVNKPSDTPSCYAIP